MKIKNVRYPVHSYEPVHTGLIRVVRFSSVPRMPRMPFTARAPYLRSKNTSKHYRFNRIRETPPNWAISGSHDFKLCRSGR